MEWLRNIEIVIFDLDGTLYQDHTFISRYVRYMLEGTEHEGNTDTISQLIEDVMWGKAPVKLGHFYDPVNKYFLEVESFLSEKVAAAFDWVGEKVDISRLTDEKGNYLFPFSTLVNVGAAWLLIACVAGSYFQIPEHKIHDAFVRIREEMVRKPYMFLKHEGMINALKHLTSVKRVLITNTYEKSAKEFIKYMGLEKDFDEIFYGSRKPDGVSMYMDNCIHGFKPEQVLSIGDNGWNDLLPVKKAGGRTCLICPYPNCDRTDWDVRLESLDELEVLLNEIQKSKM